MNLRQLEILRAVIRHRTTVAAADELALSQPAVSNALKTMEAQAGFALFERVNNRLFPTAEAMALYKESEAIFACLLYTSPSPRDGLLSRMPSSA